MRRFTAPLAFLGLAAVALWAGAARADDPAPDPLAKARALEREGQELLDAGRCAEGARHMAEAWRIRAEVWGGGAQPVRAPDDRAARERAAAPPPSELKQKLEALHAALHAQELAIDEARRAGAERAEAEHREAADALRRQILLLRNPEARAMADAIKLHRRDGLRNDLAERLAHVRAERKEAEALAEKLAAEGKGEEAAAQKARAEKLHREAEELAAAARAQAVERGVERGADRPDRPGGSRGAAAVDGLAGDVARLRAEVEEVRRLLEALRARLGEPGK